VHTDDEAGLAEAPCDRTGASVPQDGQHMVEEDALVSGERSGSLAPGCVEPVRSDDVNLRC
jgi:hypothetical protein